jgi:hypothetical protein
MKPLSTDSPDAPATTSTLTARPARLALRVSGSKVGTAARPAADGAVGGRGLPTRRFGLRIHTNALGSNNDE